MIGGLRVAAAPCVFDGDAFPPIYPRDWLFMEKLLGKFQLKTRFYDANHQLVEKPTRVGRYGAVVDIESERAPTERRRLTLYRTPAKVFWWSDRTDASIELPKMVGISPKVQKQQTAILGSLLLRLIEFDVYTSDEPAVALAFLHELNDNAKPAGPFNAARFAEYSWWHEQRRQMNDLQPYKYLVHIPPGATSEPSKRWPTILSLHGGGNTGDDLDFVSSVGPLAKLRKVPDPFPFIIVTPQCHASEHCWDVTRLADLVEEIRSKYPIDPDRLYLTGGSMGGYGTWGLAATHPEWFAAAAVISGGGDGEQAPAVANMPMWILHSDDDTIVPIERGLELVRALRKFTTALATMSEPPPTTAINSMNGSCNSGAESRNNPPRLSRATCPTHEPFAKMPPPNTGGVCRNNLR